MQQASLQNRSTAIDILIGSWAATPEIPQPFTLVVLGSCGVGEWQAIRPPRLHKQGVFKRPWLPFGEYLASKQKGGEAYAKPPGGDYGPQSLAVKL